MEPSWTLAEENVELRQETTRLRHALAAQREETERLRSAGAGRAAAHEAAAAAAAAEEEEEEEEEEGLGEGPVRARRA